MTYLAIDTSSKILTVIAVNGDKSYTYSEDCGTRHSVALMPAVESALDKVSLTLDGLNFIACVVGAGSFTGIRIGVSTVKAFCHALKKPYLAITSFDTLAYNIDSGSILAVIDAKHDCYYVAGYKDKQVVLEPSFISKETLIELSSDYTVVSCDDLPIDYVKVDSAKGLAIAVKEKQSLISDDIDGLEPLYIRKSQAEEGR
jgi:tRNA threonylcarbamoyladenosine biosynthesis protein TsaB